MTVDLMFTMHSSERLPEYRYPELIFHSRGEPCKDLPKPKEMRHRRNRRSDLPVCHDGHRPRLSDEAMKAHIGQAADEAM